MLQALYDSILPDIDKILELVSCFEIVAFNNQSTDESEQIILENQKKHPKLSIKYYRSEEFLDAGKSVERAVQLCNAEYVWIIGDDCFVSGGLLFAMEKLNYYRNDILITRSDTVNNCGIHARHYQNQHDIFTSHTLSLISLSYSYNHFFISNYIARRELFICNTYWPHIDNLENYLSNGTRNLGIIQSRPIIYETQSDWYCSNQYSVQKRTQMMCDLLRTSDSTIDKQAVQLFTNFIRHTKIKYDFKYVYILMKKLNMHRTHKKLFKIIFLRRFCLYNFYQRFIKFKKP